MPDPTEQLWPNKDQRATRRAQLHTRLGAFLENFVDDAASGYPTVSDKDVSELQEIFAEIADLKFARDPDGDQVISSTLCDRSRYRLISEHIPHSARSDDPVERAAYLSRLASSQQYLVSSAADISRTISHELNRDHVRLTRDHDIKQWTRQVFGLIDLGDADAAEDLIYRGNATLKPASETVEILRARLSEIMPNETETARAGLEKALDILEAASLDQSDGFVNDLFTAARNRFGREPFRAESQRWNLIADQRRARKKALKAK